MDILVFERKHQNSISTNFENFQNLESKNYVKENLTDILLRGETINEYVSKQFKQKKEKEVFERAIKMIKDAKCTLNLVFFFESILS